MNLQAERQSIEKALTLYRKQLDTIPDDQFAAQPPRGGWSCAEIYCHILQADLGSSIAIEKCCRKTAEATPKGPNWLGHLMMLTGRFPPVRVKAPAAIAAKVVPISKEEARNLLIKLRRRLDEITPLIRHAPKNYKVKHPRLAMLDAKQWFKFIRIHSWHHLRQLKRVEKSFPQIQQTVN